jgi:diadenosine tetraphosphatase ApaH/serine/threonine PP2A family protein phosphatase
MKLAVFSDLHANRQATEAVWAHARAEGFDKAIFLGDYVDYGADPAWVVDFLRQRVREEGAIAIKGNHDDAINHGERHAMGGHVQASLEWTRQQLNALDATFIDSLPMTAELDNCLFAHANVHDPEHWAYLTDKAQAQRSLKASPQPFIFCGHMHQPCLYNLSATGKPGEFIPTDGTSIQLSSVRRWLAIPGSTGQPRDGNPAACYLIFDTSQAHITFHRVPYDHEAAAQRILDAGLPPFLAERLREGH